MMGFFLTAEYTTCIMYCYIKFHSIFIFHPPCGRVMLCQEMTRFLTRTKNKKHHKAAEERGFDRVRR